MNPRVAFELDVLLGEDKPEFERGAYKVTGEYSAHVQELWEVYCKGLNNQHGVRM